MKYGLNGMLALLGLWVVFASEPAGAQQNYYVGWSSFVGSDYSPDSVLAVAVDSQTNTYFGGFLGDWSSALLNNDDGVSATANAFSFTTGFQDGFVAKAGRDGTLLWYTLICTSEDDRIQAVAVASNGTVYAAGVLSRTGDADEGTDASLTALSGASGLDSWTLAFGNRNGTNGFTAVAVDSNGYLYAAGYTTATNLLNPVAGSVYNGKLDACVIKVSPAGSVVWSRCLGGTNDDTAAALALAPDGSVYVGGQTRSPGWTTVATSSSGPSRPDGFIAKLSPAGATVWSAVVGGSDSNAVTALAKAPASSALYLGGATTASGFFSGGTRLNSHLGAEEGFVVSIADLGSAFQTNWCRFFGSNSADRVTALSLPTNGLVAVGGTTSSGGWLPQSATAFSGQRDGFLSLLMSDGSVSWSSYVGGTNRDDVTALAGRHDKLVSAGRTFSPYPTGWTSGGFWTDWTKDPSFEDPPGSANLSFGWISTWTAQPGLPPAVTDQPDSLTVGEGAPAVFSVAATGTAPLTYRWFRNGVPVTGLTSNTYVLAAAAPTNSGDVYACVVSNFYGTATSSNATLTVIANGALSVALAPAQAVAQGARWSLNGGATWLASGAATNLPPASYTVTFAPLAGWQTPSPLAAVAVASGATTSTSAVYTAVLPSAERAISGTNVTLTVRAPAGLSTWTLVENIPAGVTPAHITGGGVWSNGVRTLTFSGVEATTNTYSYTALCATSGLYLVSGTVTPQPSGAAVAVTGPSQILKANLVRTVSGNQVTITVYQPLANFTWSVYETLAAGLTPANITGPNAYWDPDSRTLDWFTRGVGQTLTYSVTGSPGTYVLSGFGHVTANDEPIFGDSVVTIPGGEAVPAPDIVRFVPAGSSCFLTFTSVVSQAYVILTNATPAATNGWSVCLPVTGDGGVTQREVPTSGPRLFYRVRVQP